MTPDTQTRPDHSPNDVLVQRSEKRPGSVWVYFENIWDVTNLNPAEEKQTAWEARFPHQADNDEPVGMAVVDTIPSTTFVSRIAVVKDAREHGVGTALLERLLDEYGDLACRVRTNNTASQALVESVGFTRTESRFPSLYRYETNPSD